MKSSFLFNTGFQSVSNSFKISILIDFLQLGRFRLVKFILKPIHAHSSRALTALADILITIVSLSAMMRRVVERTVLLSLSVRPFNFGYYVIVHWGFTTVTL